MKQNPLIIALDVPSSLKALYYVGNLKVTGVAFKVGLQLFMSAGPKIVEKILNRHVRVFLDLKFHDIPNTVSQAVAEATKMGVWMLNVHALGGSEMMKRAKEASLNAAAKGKIEPPLLVGVTVLTSLEATTEQVLHLATAAKKSGLDGVVASGQEAAAVRKNLGPDFALVTPGIRGPEDPVGDQKRTMSAKEAKALGSDYLVIGRPVLQASRPIKVIEKILSTL
ncbi:MAG: orotidine-5'-phosphate decarboxylase [Deltaproteobacteria bacterium]|nr:orotidine-5'-phosphate decarboxylase [Deltaproteobacteria bacterium]